MKLLDFSIMIKQALQESCFVGEVYIAGGAVRDHLLGKSSDDIDLCVHIPEGGILLAHFLCDLWNIAAPEVHPRFGTAKFRYQGLTIEAVMTRKEVYRPKNRNPIVEFADLETDVLRRDFTVNSLLMEVESGSILDLTQMGLADLEAGLIRTIGDANRVFAEDPLRILRAIRFALLDGFELESTTYAALQLQLPALKHLSAKRLECELRKILHSGCIERAMRLLEDSGVYATVQHRFNFKTASNYPLV